MCSSRQIAASSVSVLNASVNQNSPETGRPFALTVSIISCRMVAARSVVGSVLIGLGTLVFVYQVVKPFAV